MLRAIKVIFCSISLILAGCNGLAVLPEPKESRDVVMMGPNHNLTAIDYHFLDDDPIFASYLEALGIPAQRSTRPIRFEKTRSRYSIEFVSGGLSERSRLSESERRDRLNRILRSLFVDGEYAFNYSANGNFSAVDTLVGQSGNCIAFSAMIVKLAREAGLDAHFQIVDSANAWTQRGEGTVQYVRHINVAIPVARHEAINVDIASPTVATTVLDTRLITDEEATAEFLNNLGAEAMIANDLETAHRYFYSALQLAPESAGTWSNLGLLYRRMNEEHWAELAFLYGATSRYDFVTAQSNLERLYRDQNRIADADHLAHSISQFRERNPFVHQARANEAIADGNLAEALEFLEDALDQAPELPSSNFLMGLTLERLGRHEEARHYYEMANRFASHRDEVQFQRKRVAFDYLTTMSSTL